MYHAIVVTKYLAKVTTLSWMKWYDSQVEDTIGELYYNFLLQQRHMQHQVGNRPLLPGSISIAIVLMTIYFSKELTSPIHVSTTGNKARVMTICA